MDDQICPVFIFSMPRAGSTLMQRLLGTCNTVKTTAEPWLLLPQIYALKKNGAISEYGHQTMCSAISDFHTNLPNGKQDYIERLRYFMLSLYQCASGRQATHFVDKTPRYSLIVREIIDLFPNGKFIFLWRNPLAIIASMLDLWGKNRSSIYGCKYDLYQGLPNLIQASKDYSDRIYVVQYEQLLKNIETEMKGVMQYLELPFNPDAFSSFQKVQLKGGMGDPVGSKKYKKISQEPLDKWKKTLANPVRRLWAKKYLEWLGENRLETMGYNIDVLKAELAETPIKLKNTAGDIMRFSFGNLSYRHRYFMLKSSPDKD